jgi:hypothetical protein
MDLDSAPYEERLERLQSARKEAAIASYERALKDKSVRDKLVTPHKLDEGQWVLVHHEKPQKFEAKWFGPYQVAQRMLLGTYRLQDPNGRELAALVHGNRLIKANIRTADELRDLWASPKTKDKLRKRNRNVELVPSYAENTDALDQHLQDNDDDLDEIEEIDWEIGDPETGRNLKRNREIFEEITVERVSKARRM